MTALRHELADGESNGLPDDFKEMIADVFERFEDTQDSFRIEPIEYEARSGFSPYTNGGWDGVAYLDLHRHGYNWTCCQNALDADYRFMQQEFMDSKRRELSPEAFAKYEGMPYDEFWHAYGAPERCTDTADMFTGRYAAQHDLGPEQEEWRDGWESGDDDTFFVKVRAIRRNVGARWNTTGEDEVEFFAYLCLDWNYGRDGQDDRHEWSETVKLADCTAEKLAEIGEKIKAHLSAG